MQWDWDAFWRNGTDRIKRCVPLQRRTLARKDRNCSSQHNENKGHKDCDYCAGNSKTSILWGMCSIPKSELQEASGEGWRVKSASGNSGPFCSGYIHLLPAHPFNTWLAFSELSALWTCRQAGLISECMQFNAPAGEAPTWAEKRLGPLDLQLHYCSPKPTLPLSCASSAHSPFVLLLYSLEQLLRNFHWIDNNRFWAWLQTRSTLIVCLVSFIKLLLKAKTAVWGLGSERVPVFKVAIIYTFLQRLITAAVL